MRVLADAQDRLLTREILQIELAPLKTSFAVQEARLDKISWMIGVLIALAAAGFAKQFF